MAERRDGVCVRFVVSAAVTSLLLIKQCPLALDVIVCLLE